MVPAMCGYRYILKYKVGHVNFGLFISTATLHACIDMWIAFDYSALYFTLLLYSIILNSMRSVIAVRPRWQWTPMNVTQQQPCGMSVRMRWFLKSFAIRKISTVLSVFNRIQHSILLVSQYNSTTIWLLSVGAYKLNSETLNIGYQYIIIRYVGDSIIILDNS